MSDDAKPPGPAVPPRADEPCPAWEDARHMWYYRRVPGTQVLDGKHKVCICRASVGLTARGRECLDEAVYLENAASRGTRW